MVSTRRTRKAKDDQAGEAAAATDAADTAKHTPKAKPREAQSPSRRGTRRTRSNSVVGTEEVDGNEDDSVSAAKQMQPSTRKQRGSSVDGHEETSSVVDTEQAAEKEVETANEDSQMKKSSDAETPQSESVAKKPATEPITLLSISKETQPAESARDLIASSNSGNELTKLIPGYVAPLKLDTSLLDSHRPAGGLEDLCRRAQEADASTAGFVVTASEKHARAMKKSSNGCMPSTYASLYSSFKHGTKRAPDHSAGAGWFGMMPTPMTDELKTDLAVIRNRNYLDPKKFYKSADNSKNKVMQLGTVIEGSAEFYSSRLTKKQRRTNLTEEIMADPAAADYTRNKYKKMQQVKSEKGRKFNKKKLSKRARRGY